MTAKVDLQNLYDRVPLDFLTFLTIRGLEFEIEWYEDAVPATNGRVWLRVATPADKYTLVNFREVRHDQARGFYRQYAAGNFSGGTVDRIITPVPMRSDSPVATEATFEVLTGVTVDPADAFSQIPLWGDPGGFFTAGQGSGLSPSEALRVIPPGSVVLLEFENNSADPAAWYAYFKQWEVAPGALPEAGEL